MDKVALLKNSQRQELFQESALVKNMTYAVIEKDFWVIWTLFRIFRHPILKKIFIFKGGTSLSKVYKVIERFSEDIDLILDWRTLTDKNLNDVRSKNKQDKLNKKINEKAKEFIANELLRLVDEAIGDICNVTIDNDPYVVNIKYPASFNDEYLRPEIRLEIGPLAEWMPNKKYNITPYSAEVFPEIFEVSKCEVPTILAERTFWEKATILHQEAHRPIDKQQPKRYSRHYYDLAMMSDTNIAKNALDDIKLLQNVVEFKKRFYPRKWANYENAKIGTFNLIPPQHIIENIKNDYKDMKNMIYGYYMPFDEMMEKIEILETNINKLKD